MIVSACMNMVGSYPGKDRDRRFWEFIGLILIEPTKNKSMSSEFKIPFGFYFNWKKISMSSLFLPIP